MKCRCGRLLERADTDGLFYHEADLMWTVEPDCLGDPGERAPLPGAEPARAGCRLLPLDKAIAASKKRRAA